jgi:hypothetical protein
MLSQMRGAKHNTAQAMRDALAVAEAEFATSERPPTKDTIRELKPAEVQMRIELSAPSPLGRTRAPHATPTPPCTRLREPLTCKRYQWLGVPQDHLLRA